MKNKSTLKEARIGVFVVLAGLSVLACNKSDQPLAPEKSDLKLASNFQATGDKTSDLNLTSNFLTAKNKFSDLEPTTKFPGTGDKYSNDDLATICKRDKNEIGTSSALIGPAGGVLLRAKHQLVIPAGALDKTVKISFSLLPSAYLECELKPFGLKFDKPVRLVLSYNGACDSNLDASALKVAYYNPQTQLGVLVPTAIDAKQNIVTVELERFAFGASNVTRYGLIKR